jgi:hypothetical protein
MRTRRVRGLVPAGALQAPASQHSALVPCSPLAACCDCSALRACLIAARPRRRRSGRGPSTRARTAARSACRPPASRSRPARPRRSCAAPAASGARTSRGAAGAAPARRGARARRPSAAVRGGRRAGRRPAAAVSRLCCSPCRRPGPTDKRCAARLDSSTRVSIATSALVSALHHQPAVPFGSGCIQAAAGRPKACVHAAHRLPVMRHAQGAGAAPVPPVATRARGAHHGALQRPVGRGAARAHPGVLQRLRGRQAPVHVPVQQALRAPQPASL